MHVVDSKRRARERGEWVKCFPIAGEARTPTTKSDFSIIENKSREKHVVLFSFPPPVFTLSLFSSFHLLRFFLFFFSSLSTEAASWFFHRLPFLSPPRDGKFENSRTKPKSITRWKTISRFASFKSSQSLIDVRYLFVIPRKD